MSTSLIELEKGDNNSFDFIADELSKLEQFFNPLVCIHKFLCVFHAE